jgi:hypothetical protein
MGTRTIVYGYIAEPWHTGREDRNRLLRRWNRRVLAGLPPASSPAALLTGRIFAGSCDDGFKGGYLGGLLHFGVSYKDIEPYWECWLAEYESLLGRLYWESSVVQAESEVSGRHRFRWSVPYAEREGYWAAPPRLPRAWEFEGPFRSME